MLKTQSARVGVLRAGVLLAVPLLHSSVVAASSRDRALGERLALVDALRIDGAGERVPGVAACLLIERIGGINESWALRLPIT